MALIVAPVGTSSGNAVETRGNTPDGISNDRTIRLTAELKPRAKVKKSEPTVPLPL